MSETYEIEPAEAEKQLSSKQAVLLDVREPEEFAVAHLENSVLMPMQSIPPQLQRVEQMADENTFWSVPSRRSQPSGCCLAARAGH